VRAADDLNLNSLPSGAVARLGTVRLRHGELVNSVAYSPNGKTIASAGWDRTPGVGYTPPPTVQIDALTYAIVNPVTLANPGVITYQVINMLLAATVLVSVVSANSSAGTSSDVATASLNANLGFA
jgi:phage tail protein X